MAGIDSNFVPPMPSQPQEGPSVLKSIREQRQHLEQRLPSTETLFALLEDGVLEISRLNQYIKDYASIMELSKKELAYMQGALASKPAIEKAEYGYYESLYDWNCAIMAKISLIVERLENLKQRFGRLNYERLPNTPDASDDRHQANSAITLDMARILSEIVELERELRRLLPEEPPADYHVDV